MTSQLLRRVVLVLGILGVAWSARPASATSTVVTHDRFVRTSLDAGGGNSDLDQVSAPDANPFNQAVSSSIMFGGTTSTTDADQNSSFGIVGDVLTVDFVGSGGLHTMSLPGQGSADANSELVIHFSVDTASTYSITGTGTISGQNGADFYASYIARLEGPGMSTIFDFRDDTPAFPASGVGSLPVADAGVLAAGDYTLRLRALSTGVGNTNATGELDVEFKVTSPSGGAVPLPAGAWAGCAMLAGLGLQRAINRRWQRRVDPV